jgi:hypothetical protein
MSFPSSSKTRVCIGVVDDDKDEDKSVDLLASDDDSTTTDDDEDILGALTNESIYNLEEAADEDNDENDEHLGFRDCSQQ